MNKKGIIAIVVIVVLVIIGFAAFGGSKDVVTPGTNNATGTPSTSGSTKDDFKPTTSGTTDSTLMGRLKSASVLAAETGNRVALSNGAATFTEGDVKGSIALGDVAVEKTVAGKKYVLANLGVTSAGSTYQYVVLFEERSSNLVDLSYALIGKGKVTGIRADEVADANGKPQIVVSVSYTEGSAKTKILIVENGLFNPAKEINL